MLTGQQFDCVLFASWSGKGGGSVPISIDRSGTTLPGFLIPTGHSIWCCTVCPTVCLFFKTCSIMLSIISSNSWAIWFLWAVVLLGVESQRGPRIGRRERCCCSSSVVGPEWQQAQQCQVHADLEFSAFRGSQSYRCKLKRDSKIFSSTLKLLPLSLNISICWLFLVMFDHSSYSNKFWKHYLFFMTCFYHRIYFKCIITIFIFSQNFWIRRMIKRVSRKSKNAYI
jgi:hypothetical protein